MKNLFSSSSRHNDDAPPSYPAGSSSGAQSELGMSGTSYPSDAKTALPPAPPQHQQSFSTPAATFACVQLARRDRVRLIGFPEAVIPVVADAIRRVWITGIQSEGPHGPGAYEWKLSGNPWSGYGHEAIPCRRLIIHLFHSLASVGWHIHVSADLSKKEYDKDTLFFRAGPPVQRYYCSVSFNQSDKIRMIDSPNQAVLEAFKSVVGTWQAGIQDAKWKEEGCWQIKLRGNPWYTSNGGEINYTRMLLCQLLSAMDAHGFILVASVDMSVGQENVGDLDTWFFANKL